MCLYVFQVSAGAPLPREYIDEVWAISVQSLTHKK